MADAPSGSRGQLMNERRQMALIGSVVSLVAIAVVGLPAPGRERAELAAAAALAIVLAALASWWSPPGWIRPARRLVPFALFIVIGILRDGAGGTASGFSSLVLFPVLWLAL